MLLNKKFYLAFATFSVLMSYYQNGFPATISVTTSSDGHESISPKNAKVKNGKQATFTIKTKKGYKFSKLVAGDCPAGKWKGNKYKTGPITKSCKVYFSAGLTGSRMLNVTPTKDANVTVSPDSIEKIISGTLAQFKVTPIGSGYTVSQSVGGTCPQGVWLDSVYYKLGPIKQSCTVTFSGTNGNGGGGGVTFNVTPSGDGNESIAPNSAQSTASGATASFQVTANSNFILSQAIGGTCPIGSWNGSTYTTGSISGNCTVTFSAAPHGAHKWIDGFNNVYIAASSIFAIRKVDGATKIISTVAGNGTQGTSGDGGPATAAQLNFPFYTVVDNVGNIYISDAYNIYSTACNNSHIRKVSALTGIITNIAGTGTCGFSGDEGPATQAEINAPYGIAFDSSGNIYFADSGNGRIRKIDTSGIITTVVGGGTGNTNQLNDVILQQPRGLFIDDSGYMWITDYAAHTVYKADLQANTLTTIAGNGVNDYYGDGDQATLAAVVLPNDVSLDNDGNLFIDSPIGQTVRKVDLSTGIITTIANTPLNYGYSGDGGPATEAQFKWPTAISFDSNNNLYVADESDSHVRIIDAITGIVNNFAGLPGVDDRSYTGDGGPATSATIGSPFSNSND